MKKFIYSMLVLSMIAFAFTSCEDVPAPYVTPVPNGNQSQNEEGVYLNESFASGFGSMTVTTAKGTPWIIDHSAAKATGYDNASKTTTPSRSFIVSQPLDLSKSKGAFLQFEYILRYFTNSGAPKPGVIDRVLITDKYSGDPTTTTWETLVDGNQLTEGSDWNTWSIFSGNLPDKFIGIENVVVALEYACEDNSATWEVKNLLVKEGEASGGTPETPIGSGDGSEEKPYNVTAAISVSTSTGSFVKGYIVGYIYGKSASDGAAFDADTCTVSTNVLIADDPNETDVTKCMAVQLPRGVVRNGINLKDHKENLKHEVTLYGQIAAYFGQTGLKNVTYAKLGSTEYGTNPNGGGTTPTAEPKGTGTQEDPFNFVAAANEASKLANGATSEQDYYIKGKISEIKESFGSQYGNATFFISDDGTTAGQFQIFRCLYLGNKKWVEGNTQIKVGDEVIVCGKLTNYNGTPETAGNKCYLHSLNGVTE